MAIPVIKPGEALTLYEDGHEVARVRLRYSDLGVVLEVAQRKPGTNVWIPWSDMVHLTTVNGRITFAVTGRRGDIV
jgi:hypothetical protein